jgi:hypothetical protein
VRVDQPGQHRRATEIDNVRAGGNRDLSLCANGRYAIALDDDDWLVRITPARLSKRRPARTATTAGGGGH